MIDYVVPMVFPDDALWIQDFTRTTGSTCCKNHCRWRSWGTERSLVRLVRKNMPFVRNIFVLLARKSQKQAWMDEEGVRVVYHRDFIPEKFLPLFNSSSIEMFLKNIPDLSDSFLYGNDDMFPLSPLKETDFFIDGKPCQRMKEQVYPEYPNMFQRKCLRGLNFVAKEFGQSFTKTWLKNGHSIAPILKSTCEHLWKRGWKEIEGSITPLRDERNFNQYIYCWWQHFSGEYVDYVPKREYFGVNRNTVEEIVSGIREEDAGIVCINDNERLDDCSVYSKPVRKALEEVLANG